MSDIFSREQVISIICNNTTETRETANEWITNYISRLDQDSYDGTDELDYGLDDELDEDGMDYGLDWPLGDTHP